MKKGQERLRVLMAVAAPAANGRGGGGGRSPMGPNFGLNRSTLVVAAWLRSACGPCQLLIVSRPTNSRSSSCSAPNAVGTEGLNFAPWPRRPAEVVPRHERTRDRDRHRPGRPDGQRPDADQRPEHREHGKPGGLEHPRSADVPVQPGRPRRHDPAAVSEAAMRDIIARSELAPILNRDRGVIASDLRAAVQSTLDSYQSGIKRDPRQPDRADPPEEVIDAFREVQAAQQKRDRLQNEADAYANRELTAAARVRRPDPGTGRSLSRRGGQYRCRVRPRASIRSTRNIERARRDPPPDVSGRWSRFWAA